MSPRKGSNQTQLHYLSTSVQQAISELFDRYPDPFRKSTQTKSFIKLFQLETNAEYEEELMSLGFGREAENGSGFKIGLVGQIWALLCLQPLSKELQASAGRTPLGASYVILGHGVEKNDAHRLSLLIKSTTTDFSADKNKQRITPTELNRYFKKVKSYAAMCLARAGVFLNERAAAAKLDQLLERDFSSPQSCAEYLYIELGLEDYEGGRSPDAEALGPLHDFEPVLQQFIDNEIASEREKDDDIEGAINEVLKRLEDYKEMPSKPHLALILGQEQSGKKSVVGDLLRRLRTQCAPDAPITLSVRHAIRTRLRLPILAMSVRNHDYGSLCAYVLAFLMRSNGKFARDADLAHHARLLKHQHVKSGALEEILSLIESEHEDCPALFVFLDAQGLDRDSLERVLQNSGLYRLLKRLWFTNKQSRYVVTTSAVDLAYAPRELSLKQAIVNVPRPRMDRFAWYLSTDDLRRYREPDSELLELDGNPQSLEDALNSFAASQDKDLQVAGDVLLAMSALYATGVPNRTFFDVCQLYLVDQSDIGDADEGDGKTKIYQSLIDALDNLAVLLPVCLIAATRFTEDVLTTSSLRELCRRYYQSTTEEEFAEYWQATIEKLNRVADGARTLFLSRYQQVRTDPDELGYREMRQARGNNWYMSSAVATAILEILMADSEHRALAQDSFRLIATAARRRAQLKRMKRSEEASSSDRGEIARDIQCFVSLLASLPKDHITFGSGKSGTVPNRALRLSLDEVFTIGTEFNPVHALRFAVQCVLRQDIDEGYRLSMVTDQDELRLRLYLLIFFPVGQIHTWTIAELRKCRDQTSEFLPERLPQHVVNLFDTKTQLDLLLTVALAAYHSQLPHVVAWAWKMSLQVDCPTPTQSQSHLIIRARIAGTLVDAGIATGRHLVTDGDLNDLLVWTVEQSVRIVSELGFDPLDEASDVGSVLPDKLKLVQTRMRLASREAELNWIARDDLRAARRIYACLEKLEHTIARHIDQSEPVVLSGRTARRFARLLCWDYPVFAEPWFLDDIPPVPPEVTRKIRHVIEANIGRLNHYAGADRIGVLVDQARRHSIAKDFELAHDYIRDAYSRLENSKISHGGRLDLLAVKAGIHLAFGERALDSNELVDEHIASANKHIETLLSMSKSLEFDSPKIVGEFLKSRSKMLENASKGYALLENKADKSLDRCIKTAKKAGYSSAEQIARRWKSLAKKYDETKCFAQGR